MLELRPTRNDLPAATRAAIIGILNERLADAVDLATQLKQAHWNVKGPNFIALHELFDSVYGTVASHADEIAERIAALGGTAEGTAAAAVQRSILPSYPADASRGTEHVEAVSTALGVFGKAVRASIDRVAEFGDAGTEDLFVEVSREIDKSLWLVEAHVQSD